LATSQSRAPHGWLDGDFNGDGKVTPDDIGIIIGSGTFNHGSYGVKTAAKVAKASATLTAGEVAATTTERPYRRRLVRLHLRSGQRAMCSSTTTATRDHVAPALAAA